MSRFFVDLRKIKAMKNLICYVIAFLMFNSLLAQKNNYEKPNLPIDIETNTITYTEVVVLDTTLKKDELYSRAREWFAKTYKSANSVIQMDDKEDGKIVGRASIPITYNSIGIIAPGGSISYNISVYVKDGKYKYEFANFQHQGDGNKIPSYGSCTKMLNTTDKYLGIGMQKTYNVYLNQMHTEIIETISSLKSTLALKSISTKEW
jgi:hypothetical protein